MGGMGMAFRAIVSTLSLCVVLSWTSNCLAQEMTTIEKYMEQNDFERNPGAAEFIFLRCASLYTVIGVGIGQNAGLHKESQAYIEGGKQFLGFLAAIPNPSSAKHVGDQMQRMVEAYRERWLRSKALTGNFSDDPIIRSDGPICSKLLKTRQQ